MDRVQDKLTPPTDPTEIAQKSEQCAQERPIEMGSISASTKGGPLGNKGDGGGGLQNF